MATFGHRQVVPNTEGDTWDSAWLSNGKVYLRNNDGFGFGIGNVQRHDCLSELTGTPENPTLLIGQNLNPGSLGNFLGGTYSTSLYEVDGVLYHIICYSQQIPGAWVFHHTSIMKSLDGGATWINHLGQLNTLPPDSVSGCMFPSDAWGLVNFVKYGQGGDAPNIDNAQRFVYLSSPRDDYNLLARIKRTDLPALDKTKTQFYAGGDPMKDVSWSSDIDQSTPIYSQPEKQSGMGIVYNKTLGRYLMTSFTSDSWTTPPVQSTLRILEGPHPWGPWALIADENVNNKEGDNLTWQFLCPSLTSGDGTKMWQTVSGRSPYGLQFMPVYLTTSHVQNYEAENAELNKVYKSTENSGYFAKGYVTGFDRPKGRCRFHIDVAAAGTYLLQVRYRTQADQTMVCTINQFAPQNLKLGTSHQNYTDWSEISLASWLNKGHNTIDLVGGSSDTGNIDVDRISLAFYASHRIDINVPGKRQ
jgi:hypothetical protein